MTNDELKSKISQCACPECRALTGLIKDAGAKLMISTLRGGRFCELAVVAAAGTNGIASGDIVLKRREYAEHLGIQLAGNTQNGDEPGHIRWAVKYSNHTTDAKDPNGRINLGRAHASEKNGRLYLTWSEDAEDRFVSVPLYVEQDGSKTLFLPTLATSSGYWIGAKGEERCIPDYWEALGELNAMATPRFRRANHAGNRGIVACAPGNVEDVKSSYINRLIKQVQRD
jgi:hypothetical protein